MKASIDSWCSEFRGDSACLLYSIITDYMKATAHYARYAAQVQSSGTGKSKTNDELAKTVIYVPINLAHRNAQAYPPGDYELRDWLLELTPGQDTLPCLQLRMNASFLQQWLPLKSA
ncbi:hypothetical protein B0H10DRAFT_1006946 [Mycena sp. CBHHK59/15]|nr:hypothetical protein B0H10DRAFT_1006946 [Mycena sp. CBHHK59/15]